MVEYDFEELDLGIYVYMQFDGEEGIFLWKRVLFNLCDDLDFDDDYNELFEDEMYEQKFFEKDFMEVYE